MYTKQTWSNGPSGGTPASAARLQHMEDGIAAAVGQDELVINVKAHGVAGGSDDMTAAVNSLAAGLAAFGTGWTVRFTPDTYKFSDKIIPALPDNTTLDLRGATLDWSGMAAATALNQRFGIDVAGSESGPQAITTAPTKWGKVIAGIADTSMFTDGDLVIIRNTEPVTPGNTNGGEHKGEMARIASVDSSTQVTLTTGVIFDYAATGLTISKVTPVKGLTILGGTILMGGAGSGHNGVRVSYGQTVKIIGTTVRGGEDKNLTLYNVYDGIVADGTFTDATEPVALGGGTGYGVCVLEGSKHIRIRNNYFRNCKHHVSGGGSIAPSFVDVEDNHGEQCLLTAYEAHEPAQYWTFINNTSNGSVGAGIGYRGQYAIIEDNHIFDAGSAAITLDVSLNVTEQRGIRIHHNDIHGGTGAGVSVDGQTGTNNCLKIDTEITDNLVENVAGVGILLRHFDGAQVTGNTVRNAAQRAIYCVGLATTNKSKNLILGNNRSIQAGSGGTAVEVVNVVGVTEGGGSRASGSSRSGFHFTTCDGVDVGVCHAEGNPNFGIEFTTCTAVTLCGGSYTNNPTNIRADGCTDISVADAYTGGGNVGVVILTSEWVKVTGVNVRNNASGTKINVDANTVHKIIRDCFGFTPDVIAA